MSSSNLNICVLVSLLFSHMLSTILFRYKNIYSRHNISLYKTLGGNEDYDSGPYTAMLPAGMTRVTVNISVADDNIFEGNRNFTASIDLLSLPSYVTTLNPNEAIVTILEDDGKLCSIILSRVIATSTDFIKNF